MARILVIDDDPGARYALRQALDDGGHEVLEAEGGVQGVAVQKAERCDLVITDIIMPDKGGLSAIVEMKREDEDVKIIAISGGGRKNSRDYLDHAMNLGADRRLAKPFTGAELIECVDACLEGAEDPVGADDSERTLERFMPGEFLGVLGVGDVADVEPGRYVERKVTVLFTDIRDFTTLSESMTPRENIEFINALLDVLVPVIHENGGIVDKFIGDAVMALFCEDADSAVSAGLALLRALDGFNARRPEFAPRPVRMGVGLNTGIAMMGAVGNNDRMETTVIGDSVNLSSRMESLTKTYGAPLLVSEATLNALEEPARFNIRFVDRVRVKGKARAVSVYEVFDNDPDPLRRAKLATRTTLEKALAHYHLEDVEKARELLEPCLKAVPGDAVARVYLDRCREYARSGRHHGTGEIKADVQWSDDFLVRISPVDEQHMELLANINRLSRMIREDRLDGIEDVLDFLGDYAQNHFRLEEDLMRRHEYPLIREHMQEHQRFLEYYTALRADIESQRHDKLYLLFKIDVFLTDWLIDHTTKVDKHMGKYLLEAGSRLPSDRES